MLHQDDPLSTSIFDNALSSSMQQPTISTLTSSYSMYPQLDEDDPWSNVGSTILGNAHDDQPLILENVLDGVHLPDLYNILFTQTQRSQNVTLQKLYGVLSRTDMNSSSIDLVMELANPTNKPSINQTEFYVALALAACAQHGLDVSLNSVYKHRHALSDLKLNDIHYPHSNRRKERTSPIISPLDPVQREDDKIPDDKIPAQPSASTQKRPTNDTTKKIDTSKWMKDIEEVKITIAPEREGFIFKHVNYIVENPFRSSIVLRRFSDFWWLMEVLLRRYPYRALPNLPPKKLGGRDGIFLEKRRKGLARFLNAVLRHPVLRKDEVVSTFLTEPSELAIWRRQNPPLLEEEYRLKKFSIEDMQQIVPKNLNEKLQKTRKRIDSAIEHYVNLCFIMGRMMLRMHGQANDYARYSLALSSLAESEHRFHASECRNCQQVVKGYEDVAKHMQRESALLDNQVNTVTDSTVENLKRIRDLLVAFRDLDERKERLLANYRPDLFNRRIAAHKAKISQHLGVPGSEVEIERLEEAIRSDEAELIDQQRHQVFIQFCIWSEIIYLHKQQALVSALYRDYTQRMMEFTKHHADNWIALEGPVFEMPVELDLFE